MKRHNDERAVKYGNIVYDWWNDTVVSNFCVSCTDVRKEYYSEQDFYVISIGMPYFLEPRNYKRDPEMTDDMLKYCRMLGWNNYLSLDQLSDLNTRLKESGAKHVYIHPSEYCKTWIKNPRTIGEMAPEREGNYLLVVIQDEDIESDLHV